MTGPLYRSAREVMDDVPAVGDCDRMAAESVLTLFRTPCGQAYLRSTSPADRRDAIESTARVIGVATDTVRRNAAAQEWQVSRASAALESARWVLEFAAMNRHMPSSAWPPEAARKLAEALQAVGAEYRI